MKKRILCVLLTLIMLISLVPATAITAAAATGAVSESAITVLKKLEGYTTSCGGYGKTFGYGTVCTDKKCDGTHNETEADVTLRAELKELDKAVNAFASNKGLSLSQGQHDALVLFSFQNGTAWTLGSGDLQFAIANRKTGAEFLEAITSWKVGFATERRLIEANMYLYGKYITAKPDYFVQVTFDAQGGTMTEKSPRYYDLNSSNAVNIVPTKENYKFLGWFDKPSYGTQIKTLTKDTKTLYAMWQYEGMDADSASSGTWVNYSVKLSDLASWDLYRIPSGKEADIYTTEDLEAMMEAQEKDSMRIMKEYIDADGVRWGYISTEDFAEGNYRRWVKLGKASFGGSSTVTGMSMDVMVTVTNAYVNSRENASIFSNKIGSYSQGAKLRIINTANADGFVWGQVAKSADDATPVGWVALMYTDFDASKNQSNTQSTNVIATARITYNGYVNVRSGAGTDNQIVGALPHDLEVDLYETKYVNGIQWGRCNTGWFCLSYAEVNRLVADTGASSDVGFTSYAFTGNLKNASDVFTTAGGTVKAELKAEFDGKNVVITNLTDVSGAVWGKIAEGWVALSNVELTPAKFYVIADKVTVRDAAGYSKSRIDTLIKGVEFDVDELKIVDGVIWGKADKDIDDGVKTYAGWVDLVTKNVSRDGAPAVGGTGNSYTGKIATVINTESVRVRETGATYGRVLGSLANGTTAAVLAESNGWYKLDIEVDDDPTTDSWVSGTYLNVREGTISSGTQGGTTGNTGATATETGKGVVANTYSGVNVRSGAGTAYAAITKLLPGTSVEILEVKTVGAAKWGRIAQGWVCMDYISMIDLYPVGGTTGSNSTTTSSQVAIYTGTVTEPINVRKTTSLDAEVVRQVKVGEPITLHELITVVIYEDKIISDTETNEGATVTTEKKTQYWARINDGYVYNPGKHLVLNALAEEGYTLAKDVKDIANLGDGEAKFTLKSGEQVKVTKLQIEKNYVNGYVECAKGEGWVAMTNMTKGFANTSKPEVEETPNTNTNTGNAGNTQAPVVGSTGNTTGGYANASGHKYTGKVINTNSVNVRATASTGANITTTLKNGAALVIYETVISDGMAWGRCDAGWVYLYYVDLTPTVNGAVDARVVYNDNTLIYSDMNCSATTGSTYAKMAVIDIYEIVGKMARTDLGWVNTDNLL